MSWRISLLLLLVGFPLAGCGYRPAASVPIEIPGGADTLAIRTVENPTLETWLGPSLRTLVREEILRRTRITWATVEQAEALMDITIVTYSTGTLVTGRDQQTLKSDAVLTARATIRRRRDNAVLWTSGNVSGRESFINEAEVNAAGEEAARRVAQLLVDRLDRTF